MNMKICAQCKMEKPVSEFYRYKNRGKYFYYFSNCKKCESERRKVYNPAYRLIHPWANTLNHILYRCKRGYAKNYLNTKDLKFLWFRDRAFEMKNPSIDRKNTYGDYTLENCRYIELTENMKRDRKRKETWALEYKECKNCGTVKIPHNAKGLCMSCYVKKWRVSRAL